MLAEDEDGFERAEPVRTPVRESIGHRRVIVEGKRRIMLGSNNYLGLTTNPEIMEVGIHAIEQWKMTSKTAWTRLRQALTSPGSP